MGYPYSIISQHFEQSNESNVAQSHPSRLNSAHVSRESALEQQLHLVPGGENLSPSLSEIPLNSASNTKTHLVRVSKNIIKIHWLTLNSNKLKLIFLWVFQKKMLLNLLRRKWKQKRQIFLRNLTNKQTKNPHRLTYCYYPPTFLLFLAAAISLITEIH